MRFSVITVTRNNLAGLQKTCNSVLGQRFDDFEWLVVDGASTDGSQAWLTDTAGPRAKLLSEPDRGLYDAMNKGIARAGGDFLIFMNAGDQFFGRDVLAQVDRDIDEGGGAAVLYGDAYEADGERMVRKRALPHRFYWYSMFTHHQAIFYDRRCLGDGYDLEFALSADWALTAGLLRRGATARRLPVTVCIFERGGVSQSPASAARARAEHRRILREIIGLPPGVDRIAFAAKTGVNLARRRLPRFYDLLRGRI